MPGNDLIPHLSVPRSCGERAGLSEVPKILRAQIPPGESRFPGALTHLRAEVRPLLLYFGTNLEPSWHRNWETVWDSILPVSSYTWSWQNATTLCTQIWWGKSKTLRSTNYPESTGKTTTSAHIPHPRGTSLEPSGHQNWGAVWKRIFHVCTCAQSWPCDTVLCTQLLLGETWSPGVLTHKLTGRSSHRQRQKDKLTPGITG